MIGRRISGCVLVVLASLGWQATGMAQDEGDYELQIEEIIVTARRVEENLQDVPMAINAFTAQVIEEAGIADLNDIAMLTPGLTFSNIMGDTLATPVIRGMAPLFAIGDDNNAAVFVDGIYVSSKRGMTFSMLDLERIEVVKGPQSAMYGRNAFSGAINFVTARPSDEMEGKGELTVGTDGLLRVMASVSGPLVADVLSGRIAVLKDEYDGAYNNAMTDGPDDIGGHDFKTVHGSLYWTPSESFAATATLYYSDEHIGPPAMQSIEPNCEDQNLVTGGSGVNYGNYCGSLPSIGKDDLAVLPGAWGQDRELTRATLTLAWDKDYGTITSLTGYTKVETDFAFGGDPGNGDSLPYAYGTAPPFVPGPLKTFNSGLILVDTGEQDEELSTELRFTSPADRSFRYSVGGYYYQREYVEMAEGEYATNPLPADFAGFCPCVQFFPGFGFTLGFGNYIFGPWFQPGGSVGSGPMVSKDTDSWALFSYLEQDFADSWTARVEARYTDEKKAVHDLLEDTIYKDSWDFVTWGAGLRWNANEDLMFYGSVASAQKAGDIQETIVGNVVQIAGLDPEKTSSIEFGVKGMFFDGRMRADAAVFYTDWEDIVLQTIREVEDGEPVSVRENAGDAVILGIEGNLMYLFTEHLQGTLGATITDTEMKEGTLSSFAKLPSFAPDGDISGNELHRQSSKQANASLTYRNALTGNSEWYWRADALYQGAQWVHLTNQGKIPSRTIGNLRVGVELRNFTFELWSTNVFDDDTPVAAFRGIYFSNARPDGSHGFFTRNIQVTHPRARVVGLTARVRF